VTALQGVLSDFRQTLPSAMPKLLTNGHKTPKEEMRELIDAVKWKALRERRRSRSGCKPRAGSP
jgi:hypothetical protein